MGKFIRLKWVNAEQKHKSMTTIILTEMRQETDADYLSKLMIDRGKVFEE